jgi:hypothetical protein
VLPDQQVQQVQLVLVLEGQLDPLGPLAPPEVQDRLVLTGQQAQPDLRVQLGPPVIPEQLVMMAQLVHKVQRALDFLLQKLTLV